MDLNKYSDGLLHLAIPAKNIDETIEFYEKLGFELIYKKHMRGPENPPVCFLKLGNYCIETYFARNPVWEAGCIDHVALNVNDVEACYKEAVEEGYKITTNGIEFMDCWDNSFKYFKIAGPNGESIEFGQIL